MIPVNGTSQARQFITGLKLNEAEEEERKDIRSGKKEDSQTGDAAKDQSRRMKVAANRGIKAAEEGRRVNADRGGSLSERSREKSGMTTGAPFDPEKLPDADARTNKEGIFQEVTRHVVSKGVYPVVGAFADIIARPVNGVIEGTVKAVSMIADDLMGMRGGYPEENTGFLADKFNNLALGTSAYLESRLGIPRNETQQAFNDAKECAKLALTVGGGKLLKKAVLTVGQGLASDQVAFPKLPVITAEHSAVGVDVQYHGLQTRFVVKPIGEVTSISADPIFRIFERIAQKENTAFALQLKDAEHLAPARFSHIGQKPITPYLMQQFREENPRWSTDLPTFIKEGEGFVYPMRTDGIISMDMYHLKNQNSIVVYVSDLTQLNQGFDGVEKLRNVFASISKHRPNTSVYLQVREPNRDFMHFSGTVKEQLEKSSLEQQGLIDRLHQEGYQFIERRPLPKPSFAEVDAFRKDLLDTLSEEFIEQLNARYREMMGSENTGSPIQNENFGLLFRVDVKK